MHSAVQDKILKTDNIKSLLIQRAREADWPNIWRRFFNKRVLSLQCETQTGDMYREVREQWVDERSLSSNQHQTSELCRFLIAITVCLYPYCLESPQTFSLLNISVVCCCTNESTHKTCCKLLFPLKFYFGKIRVKNKVCFTFVLRDPSWLSPNPFNVQRVLVCGTSFSLPATVLAGQEPTGERVV